MTAVLDILDAVDARLGLVKKTNGYSETLKKIDRSRIKVWDGYDLPAVNYWPTSLSSERSKYGYDERTLELFVEVHTKTRDEPFVNVADALAADIINALHRTPAAPTVADAVSLKLGGLVESLRFSDYQYWIGDGQKPFCGVLVRFEIKYHAPAGDMETIGD